MIDRRQASALPLAAPIARMPLDELAASNSSQPPVTPPTSTTAARDDDFEPLTIPQAELRLTSVMRCAGATVSANSAPASPPYGVSGSILRTIGSHRQIGSTPFERNDSKDGAASRGAEVALHSVMRRPIGHPARQ